MIPGSDPRMFMSSGQHHQALPLTHSPMRTVTEFLNSNHPLVAKLRYELASKGPLPSSSSSNLSGVKSAPRARFLIDRGCDEFHSRKYGEASQYFSQSIATAPMGSIELAMAFVHRSKVLFIRKRYDLCLLDVNRALIFGSFLLPENIKQDLLERRRRCLIAVENMKISQLKAMEDHQGELKRDGILHRTYERQFLYHQPVGFNKKINIDASDLTMDYGIFDDPIWSTKLADNDSLPGASSKIAVVYDIFNGKQLIAEDNIEPGEVLLIREYLMVLTVPFQRYIFCAYCALRCEALIPCPTCTQEMYCSVYCRLEAYGLYHRTECVVSGMLRRGNDGVPFNSSIALRMFLTGTGQGAVLAKLMNDPNVSALMNARIFQDAGLPEEYVFDNNYYKYLATLNTLYRICQDNTYVVPCSEILFNDVILIINALRSINFFNNEGSSSLKGDDRGSTSNNLEIFAALLLLQHMRIRTTQCAETLQFDLFEKTAVPPTVRTREYFGVGVGNWRNLMTHSCNPNTALIQNRRRSLIYSTRPIPRGEMIHCAFDPTLTYAEQNQEKRERILKEREITCFCEACTGNWPVRIDLLTRKNVYLTLDNRKVKEIEEMNTAWLLREDINLLLYKQFSYKLAQNILTFIRTIRQFVKEPSGTILLSEELIQNHMRLRGNFYVYYRE